MFVRAIRGATTVETNTDHQMLEETKTLLSEICERNQITQDDIISIIFTVTHDLDAAFPAVAAREIGWCDVALLCMNEVDVPGSLKMCIRVLMHINTDKEKNEIKHIYLNKAKALRPDLFDGRVSL